MKQTIIIKNCLTQPLLYLDTMTQLLKIGNFNSHVGTNDTFKFAYHRNNNQNGRLLIDYSQETSMMIANTFFRKRTGKLWTIMSDSTGAKTQVDYLLIRRKWKNSLDTCEPTTV